LRIKVVLLGGSGAVQFTEIFGNQRTIAEGARVPSLLLDGSELQTLCGNYRGQELQGLKPD